MDLALYIVITSIEGKGSERIFKVEMEFLHQMTIIESIKYTHF